MGDSKNSGRHKEHPKPHMVLIHLKNSHSMLRRPLVLQGRTTSYYTYTTFCQSRSYTGGPHARSATPLCRHTRGGTSSGTGSSTVTMRSLRRACKYTGTATPGKDSSPPGLSVAPSGRRVQQSRQRVRALRWSLENARVLAVSLQPAPSSTSPMIGNAIDESDKGTGNGKAAETERGGWLECLGGALNNNYGHLSRYCLQLWRHPLPTPRNPNLCCSHRTA